MDNKIKNIIDSSIKTKYTLFKNVDVISDIVEICVKSLTDGNSIYWCGNGGSAADAQHLSAELSGRFYYDRPPLASEALHCNTSYLTAVGNDYGFEHVYSRLLKGIGKKGDVIIGLSTSGKSKNIINAFKVATEMGIKVIGLSGSGGGQMGQYVDREIVVESNDTPRIQEAHTLIGHIICELIEEKMLPKHG